MSIYAEPTVFEGKYPHAPYNFDVPPPEYILGPIKTILFAASKKIEALLADIAIVESQVSVQNATGAYLDAHGVLYNTPRLLGEIDGAYRTRILAALTTGKLTIPAILKAVQNYVASTAPQNIALPTVTVYDLQSNPARCALDAAAGTTVNMFEFVIEINRKINESEIFFLNYSYLTSVTADPLTLFRATTSYTVDAVDPALVAVVNGVKAANTRPIFKSIVTVVTS